MTDPKTTATPADGAPDANLGGSPLKRGAGVAVPYILVALLPVGAILAWLVLS